DREVRVRRARIARAVQRACATRGENIELSIRYSRFFHLLVRPPEKRVIRIIRLHHRIPKIRDPRQTRPFVEELADQMRSGDRERAPQNCGPITSDEAQPCEDSSRPPRDPAIRPRERCRITTKKDEM